MTELDLDLSEALEAFGTPEFQDILGKKLDEAERLPLDYACKEGQPSNPFLLTVTEGKCVDGFVIARATVGFTELVGSGGCEAVASKHQRFAFLNIMIEKPSGEATVTLIQDEENDPEPEF
jgi:hypothetical protein